MLKRLLFVPTDNTLAQLLRYLFVGGTAFVVDFGVLFALTRYAGLHYLLAATLAFIAGLTVNYLLSIAWVFRRSTLESRAAEFVLFGVIGVVGLGLTAAIMWLSVEQLHLHHLLSKIVATIVVFLWNFTARKYLLFNGKK